MEIDIVLIIQQNKVNAQVASTLQRASTLIIQIPGAYEYFIRDHIISGAEVVRAALHFIYIVNKYAKIKLLRHDTITV